MQFSISIESPRARGCNNIILMIASSSRVCWNQLSTASLEGKRSDKERMNKNQTEKYYAMLFISVEISWACKVDYSMSYQSIHRGCAGTGHQPHPLKAMKLELVEKVYKLVCMRHSIRRVRLLVLVCSYARLFVPMSVPPSFRPSVCWSFYPRVSRSGPHLSRNWCFLVNKVICIIS